MKMALLTTIVIAVLGWYSLNCEASGVEGDVSLSTPYYLDLRERVDHLDDKICDIREKMASLDSRVDTKIENLGLKLSLEIRDQLAMFLRDIKTHLVRGAIEGLRYKDEQQPHYQSSVDLVANITTKMESLNDKIMEKFESQVLPLHAATTRLDDKLYSLSEKSDVCLRAVLEERNENSTESAVGDLQGAPAYAWITILRRMDGRVNFTRGWDDYNAGFGDLGAEFWLGLEDIHQLTAVRSYRLRVVLTDFSGEVKFAEYSQFYIRGKAENYRLHVHGYVTGSTAGDSMKAHNNMEFSTFDKDNDKHGSNCALNYKGGWWYNACHSANPTGLYLGAGTIDALGISWYSAYSEHRSFKRIEMSIRHQ